MFLFQPLNLSLYTVGTAPSSPERTACTDTCSLSTSDDKTASRSVTERMSTDRTFSHSRTSCSLGRFSPPFFGGFFACGRFSGPGWYPSPTCTEQPTQGRQLSLLPDAIYMVIAGPAGSSERAGSSNSISLPISRVSKISRRVSLGMLSFLSA